MRGAINLESALGRLTTRDDSDPILAVVDAWAAALDVLTFYQERIANENYLRTAKEYRSVQEFSRQIGYRLAPGTAATTYVAFKVDDTGYGPESVRVDAGTKVQSQPGQDELPQIFETLETMVARPEYNLLPVKRYGVDALASGRQSANFTGAGFDVKPGDTLLFVAADTIDDPSKDHKALAKVTRVLRDDTRRVTTLEWSPALPAEIDGGGGLSVFIMRLRVALFGYNAIDFAALPLTLTIGDKSPENGAFIAGPYAGQSTKWAKAALSGKAIDLESLYPSIAAGSWVVLQNATTALFRVEGARETVADRFMLAVKVTHLTLDREALSPFNPKDTTVLAQSEPLTLDSWPIATPLTGKKLPFALPVPMPEKGRKMLIVGPQPDGSVAGEIVTVAEVQTGAAADEILICNLETWGNVPTARTYRDANGNPQNRAIRVGVDPLRGRLRFVTGQAPAGDVWVDYSYGFSSEMGGGPYDRTRYLPDLVPAQPNWYRVVQTSPAGAAPNVVPTLQQAIAEWNAQGAGKNGIIAIVDSETHAAATLTIEISEESQLLILGAGWPTPDLISDPRYFRPISPTGVRPHLRSNFRVHGVPGAKPDRPGSLTLDGLFIEGALTVLPGNLGELVVADATLVPAAPSVVVQSDPTDGRTFAFASPSIAPSSAASRSMRRWRNSRFGIPSWRATWPETIFPSRSTDPRLRVPSPANGSTRAARSLWGRSTRGVPKWDACGSASFPKAPGCPAPTSASRIWPSSNPTANPNP